MNKKIVSSVQCKSYETENAPVKASQHICHKKTANTTGNIVKCTKKQMKYITFFGQTVLRRSK